MFRRRIFFLFLSGVASCPWASSLQCSRRNNFPHVLFYENYHKFSFKIFFLFAWWGALGLGKALRSRLNEFSANSSPDQLISAHTPFSSSCCLFVTWRLAQGHGGVQGPGGVLLARGAEEGVSDQGAPGQDRHWRRMWVFSLFSSNFSLSPDLLATLLAKPPTQPSMPSGRSWPPVAS